MNILIYLVYLKSRDLHFLRSEATLKKLFCPCIDLEGANLILTMKFLCHENLDFIRKRFKDDSFTQVASGP